MMMPSQLRIIGKDIDVVYDAVMNELGLAEHSEQRIKIKSGQQKHIEADTLLHETIHIIDEAFQLELEERQVYCMAVALMALFKDNPQLLSYIQDAINNPRTV